MVETEFSVVRFRGGCAEDDVRARGLRGPSEAVYVQRAGDEHKAKKVYEGMQPLTADDIADVRRLRRLHACMPARRWILNDGPPFTWLQLMSPPSHAQTIFWCATLPAHVNVNTLELMPTMQAFSPFAVSRK